MKKSVCLAIPMFLFSFIVCGAANSDTVVFQDSFTGALSTNWQTGTNRALNAGGPKVGVVGGRVSWTQRYDYIESKQTFSGDFRVEVDLERGAGSNQCKDFVIELVSVVNTSGILRLQYGSIALDSINVGQAPSLNSLSAGYQGICIDDGGPYLNEMATVTPHRGTVSLTYRGGNVTFSFKNNLGETITTPAVSVGEIGSTRIRIWATMNERYVDEVRVYNSSGGCMANTTSLEVDGASYILDIPSLCIGGQTNNFDNTIRIRLQADGSSWEILPN